MDETYLPGSLFAGYDDTGDQTWFEKMDPNTKSVFFGGYQADSRPSHLDVGAMYHQYRDMNDSFSSDSRTLATSEYDTSFGGTTEATSFYSPNENLSFWQPEGAVAEDPESVGLAVLSAIVGDFKNSSSIGSARPSPNIRPQLDPEDIEGGETFLLVEKEGRAAGAPVVADSSTSLDNVQRERFKKLKRSVEKLSDQILGASGPDSQEVQEFGKHPYGNRGQEKSRQSARLESRENSHTGGHRRSSRYDHESTERSHRRAKHKLTPTHGAVLSPQQNDGIPGRMPMRGINPDTYHNVHIEPLHTPSSFRPLKPRAQAHNSSLTTPDYAHLQLTKQAPKPRPADGEYECPVPDCNRRYNLPENCRRHVRTVHEQKPKEGVKCPYCSASRGGGRGRENLNTHLKNVHGITTNAKSPASRF